ncbi:MAG: type II toxin-antitoxin system HicB family antitoxin [Spirochaetaceae bacterium]|nr:type II toxin-antitoxin system HicB family antitoxin [Spirochaetaceae bacterium]MBQ8560289.1 type II toxin-antitoxin system HicB family antitoxin [Spirochaetaceae bacterium]MBR2361366.1 type II toxin-antitoxin system HicB family antitoxin [Spirochaetaceae bacterium]
MDKVSYLAIMERSDEGYSVYFPDVPGCISWGKDVEEAQIKAREALDLHLYGLVAENERLPEASASVKIQNPTDIVCLISTYPQIFKERFENKKVKVNVTIPNWLKNQAVAEKVNFSQVLELSLKEMLCSSSQG